MPPTSRAQAQEPAFRLRHNGTRAALSHLTSAFIMPSGTITETNDDDLLLRNSQDTIQTTLGASSE